MNQDLHSQQVNQKEEERSQIQRSSLRIKGVQSQLQAPQPWRMAIWKTNPLTWFWKTGRAYRQERARGLECSIKPCTERLCTQTSGTPGPAGEQRMTGACTPASPGKGAQSTTSPRQLPLQSLQRQQALAHPRRSLGSRWASNANPSGSSPRPGGQPSHILGEAQNPHQVPTSVGNYLQHTHQKSTVTSASALPSKPVHTVCLKTLHARTHLQDTGKQPFLS